METILAGLILSCIIIAFYGSRHAWMQRKCSACRLYVPAQATLCCFCHSPLPPRSPGLGPTLPVLLTGVLLAGTAQAQSFSLMECHRISFVAEEDCAPPPMPVPAPVPPPPKAEPLFTRATVSPYTAPELLTLANDRTLDNARFYVRRQIERNHATDDVSRLVQQAWEEVGRPHVP